MRPEQHAERQKTQSQKQRRHCKKANERLQQTLLDMDAAQAQLDAVEAEWKENRPRGPPADLRLQPNMETSFRELLTALEEVQGMPDSIRQVHDRAKAALPQQPPVQPPAETQSRAPAPTGPQDRGRVRTADEASLGSGDDAGAGMQCNQEDGDLMMALQEGEDDSEAALADLVRRYRARRRAI